MSLVLYYHPLASYCHKVLVALYELGTPFERRIIDLADDTEKAELQALWPVGKFPLLRDRARGRDVPESTIINEYLDHHHPGAAPLIPHDFDQALEVRLWERFFDSHVMTPMQAIVADRLFKKGEDTVPQREALLTAYGMVEKQLADGRDWISPTGFSVADCAAAPSLFYAHTLVPFRETTARLAAYFERLVARASVGRVLDEAKPYFRNYPFADDIPARFR